MPRLRPRPILLLAILLAAVLVALHLLAADKVKRLQPGSVNDVRIHSRPGSLASDAIAPGHIRRYEELAVAWMQEYLRIDTTNPPGNELHAAEWFKRIFDAEGIENRLIQYAPGRANIWARIPAARVVNGSLVEGATRRPIVLLNHMDVVSSDPAHWRVPPFSASVVDGSMYGRGAQDMKADGLAQLMVMLLLKREQPPLDRDVIFLATADEEVKDTGTDWMIAHHRDLLGNAEYLLTEGGENLLERGEVRYVSIDVAEKVPFWLRLVAHGHPGHGSRPISDSAPNRLIRALNRILSWRQEPRVTPVVDEILRAMAPHAPPEHAARFRNMRRALTDPVFRQSVQADPSLDYLLHDTVSITMFGGSRQTNVIPNEAWAHLDVRLLPGQNPADFLNRLRQIIADPGITIEPLDGFSVGNSSPMDTPLYDVIRRVSARHFPGAAVIPRLASGYNESQRYRPLGIVCYGFTPYTSTADEGSTEHGDNERIRLEELRRGFRVLYDVVVGIAGAE